MANAQKPPGDIHLYDQISRLILAAMLVAGVILLGLNSIYGREILQKLLGPIATFCLQLFFWGALGAAIASSFFLAHDKEDNELESLKSKPDRSKLRYPDRIDTQLYLHRILTSGFLAVASGVFLYAGLSYFEISIDQPTPKQRAFFILFAFLVGLYQGNFVTFLDKRFQEMLKKPAGGEPVPTTQPAEDVDNMGSQQKPDDTR
jgi:hypothetical protein